MFIVMMFALFSSLYNSFYLIALWLCRIYKNDVQKWLKGDHMNPDSLDSIVKNLVSIYFNEHTWIQLQMILLSWRGFLFTLVFVLSFG